MDDQKHKEFNDDQAVDVRPAAPVQQGPLSDTLPAPVAPAVPSVPAPPSPAVSQAVLQQPASAVLPTASAGTLPPNPSVPAPVPDNTYATDYNGYDESDYAEYDQTLNSQPAIPPPEISWRAAEFVAHPKSAKWYAVLAGGTIAAMGLAYLISRDIITLVAIAICAGLFGYTAGRHPRELSYGLSTAGINIGEKFYPYKDFNAFAIAEEGPVTSVSLMPLKRFAPMLSIYCSQELEAGVIDVLSEHLPLSHHQRSAIDGLMHRIRF